MLRPKHHARPKLPAAAVMLYGEAICEGGMERDGGWVNLFNNRWYSPSCAAGGGIGHVLVVHPAGVADIFVI